MFAQYAVDDIPSAVVAIALAIGTIIFSKFTGKGESIGNQVELCKDDVRNVLGEEYVDRCVVFEDEGFSGGNL